jgi:iron complex transport system substrate-binding protein
MLFIRGFGFVQVPCFALGPIEIVDDTGKSVLFDRPATRIVSLYAGHTENLIALGARDKLVAASNGDDPELLGGLLRLGVKPGIERIITLKPDVVLTRPMNVRSQEALYGRLASLGVKVLAIDPPSWEEFPVYIGLLSRLTGDPDPERKANDARRLMNVNHSEKNRAQGAVLITNGRSMTTCTPDSWAAHIMERAGFPSVAADVKPMSGGSVIAALGAERLLASDKSIDVVLLQRGAMNTMRASDFMADPRFSKMKAVQNGMAFDVDEADISRPSLLRLEKNVIGNLRKIVTDGR